MTIDPAHEADRGGALAGDGGDPVVDHGETTCRPRERASAVLGIVAALILLLAIVAAALLAAGGGLGGGGAGARTAGAGIGNGRGSGIGAGDGTGSGDRGQGPGAGMTGEGRMAGAPGEASQPPGDPEGDAIAGLDEPSESVVDGTPGIEPPKFGFTAPDEPAPVVQPRSTSAPGVPHGRPAGGASGTRGGGGSEFMGVRSAGRRIVYLIDRSWSMHQQDPGAAVPRYVHATLELKRSLERLDDECEYCVIYFSARSPSDPAGYRVMPGKGLRRATREAVRETERWADAQEPESDGGTDPALAMDCALGMHPDTIYLLTDGGPEMRLGIDGKETPDWSWIDRAGSILDAGNPGRSISVNIIAFYERSAEERLRVLAESNGGQYRYVHP